VALNDEALNGVAHNTVALYDAVYLMLWHSMMLCTQCVALNAVSTVKVVDYLNLEQQQMMR